MKFTIGIDEAGRGSLAGPVSVGAFGTDDKMRSWILENVFEGKLRDSKKLSPNKREEIYKKLCVLKKEEKINFAVSHVSNKIIDRRGISFAIKKGIANCLKNLTPNSSPRSRRGGKKIQIRLDGLLKAPKKFKNQKTIVKGDEKDVLIACASIVAKVNRDHLMRRLAKKYPKYCFNIHKGYGTFLHQRLMKKWGLSEIHRVSFCKFDH